MEPPKLHRPTFPVLIAAVSLVFLVCVLIYSIQTTRDAAIQGKQTHDAMCVFKQGLSEDIVKGHAFLEMSPVEREAKFGKAFALIPESLIRSNLATQERRFSTLSILSCPEVSDVP